MMEMRKILTAEQIEKRDKKRARLLTILMLVLLLGSTAGYAFFSGTSDKASKSSNGLQQIGNQWVLTSNGTQFAFSSSPDSAREVNISSLIYDLNSYYQKPLYIVSNSSYAAYEIASTLGKFASRAQEACYGNCTLDLPQKNCTTDLLVVYNESLIENKVYQKDNCVFIDGNMTAVDAFLYKVMGLI